MMTINTSAQTNTVVDKVTGNTYTSGVTNDTLSNSDFLTLMLEELKLQDPTKPADTSSMIQNQMQMSTIETNTATIKAMESLQNSFAQSSLATASNIIGQIVENGEIGETGVTKQFKVSSVESIDGSLYIEGYELMGFAEKDGVLQPVYDSEPTTIAYGNITRVFDGSILDGIVVPDEDEDKPKPDDENTTPEDENTTPEDEATA